MKALPEVPAGPLPAGLMRTDAFNATVSDGFGAWLAEQDVALAFTTGGRLMLVGRDRDGDVVVDELPLDGPSGLVADGNRSLYVAGRWQLWRFEDALADGERDAAEHDALFLPQSAWTTGFVGAYDLALDGGGRLLLSNALCNCVATVSPRLSFTAIFKPPFVSAYVGEDRCHLTGLALDAGAPAYVTCASTSDVKDGWLDDVGAGGVVVDVRTGAIVAAGLSLPHSPRVHQGKVYVTSAGTGELLLVDPSGGAVETVARVPGLARGLTLLGRYAVVGCSQVPEGGRYANSAIAATPRAQQMHGLAVVDLVRGEVVETLRLAAASGEVFAVAYLGERRRAQAAMLSDSRSDLLTIGSS